MLSWINLRQGRPNFCLARYEDLQDDPTQELAKWATLLGIDPSPDAIAKAIELSSASNMRSLEERQSKDWAVTKNRSQDIRFVRAPKSGDWGQKLSEKSVAAIEEAWGATMQKLGYELTTTPKVDRPERDSAVTSHNHP